jgi:hypothetical protein
VSTEESNRRRGCALAAALATKAQAPLDAAAHLGWASSRLARVIGTMQRARTGTTLGLRLRGQLVVDLQQQREKPGIVEQGLAHWTRLKV